MIQSYTILSSLRLREILISYGVINLKLFVIDKLWIYYSLNYSYQY